MSHRMAVWASLNNSPRAIICSRMAHSAVGPARNRAHGLTTEGSFQRQMKSMTEHRPSRRSRESRTRRADPAPSEQREKAPVIARRIRVAIDGKPDEPGKLSLYLHLEIVMGTVSHAEESPWRWPSACHHTYDSYPGEGKPQIHIRA